MIDKNQKITISIVKGFDKETKNHIFAYYDCIAVQSGTLKSKDEFFKVIPSTGRIQYEGHFIVSSKNQFGINCKKHACVANVAKRNQKITIEPKNYKKLVLKVLKSY